MRAAATPAPPRVEVRPKPAAPPPLSALDRRKARRIEVEARIDLHGMRQSEAHSALRRFLASAHAKEKRWVLVITGKGGPMRRTSEPDDYGRGRSAAC